jgi:hypothetical protein
MTVTFQSLVLVVLLVLVMVAVRTTAASPVQHVRPVLLVLLPTLLGVLRLVALTFALPHSTSSTLA